MQVHLSISSFELTWMWQKSITFRDAHLNLICQHPKVFTLGHAASSIYPAKYVNRHRIDRGGEIAYHDCGHLLLYVLTSCPQVTHHIHTLHLVALRLLHVWRLQAIVSSHLGIWLFKDKWMSMGLKILQGRSLHGICLPIEGHLPPQFEACNIASTYLVNLEAYLCHISFQQCRYYLAISTKQNFSRHF
uniref:lipoyl(octanoyl) transferase n=1 Tax=Cyanidiococcus yangmingshanensis TaxID=2690220 RepID=A0A7G5VUX2_9RHOD|nr:lipoate-protein ligase B [Cyanidiococcus yangmingshanensis]QMX77489.1 lipoate-protein ligase B [Cyanidiococcus yangmingshanensis]UNJ15913.1 lipoate-protein ligase B [Cyanidioschyzonaceae sp. 3]WDB00398.1 lipoate biosynthesis protein B [Cyanidiococcus yangmingshanensis]